MGGRLRPARGRHDLAGARARARKLGRHRLRAPPAGLQLLPGPRSPPAPRDAVAAWDRHGIRGGARSGAGMSATRSRANPGGMEVLKVLGPDVRPVRERKPPWFKVPAPGGHRYRQLSEMIREETLHTVCQEAACPNVGECWERGTATFMILGDTCTRRYGFGNVK